MRARSADGRLLGRAAAFVTGLALAAGLVVETSLALYSSTSGTGNAFATGTVLVTDDDAGSAMFSATALTDGSTGSRCIEVAYGGSIAAGVRLYVGTSSGALAPFLDLVVEEGTGGTSSSCGAFSGTTVYTGTLAALATTSTGFASGLGTFAPTTAGQTRSYRITYTVQSGAPVGSSASATFRWEARA